MSSYQDENEGIKILSNDLMPALIRNRQKAVVPAWRGEDIFQSDE